MSNTRDQQRILTPEEVKMEYELMTPKQLLGTCETLAQHLDTPLFGCAAPCIRELMSRYRIQVGLT